MSHTISLFGAVVIEMLTKKQLTHKNECDRHTFCRNCRTTVEDDPDNKNKRHTCYIPPEIQAHSPPATLISFDLETFPKKGHHWANLATLVYNTRP